ncbi:hypothetical protein [uncultured Clostridium sp.]|uniref:hypothetical protein n=1 Tax=uncultured Clostridium sp. TaxID=59620 RepID=UPI0025F66FC1|nr:hypothetical protein [uncultured Clostridium sp.]
MKALMWKKINEIKRNKIRLAAIFLAPIGILSWFLIINIKFNDIVSYFPIITILLFSLILFSIEDFVFADVVLSTNITIKKLWSSNIILVTVFGYIYSNLLLLILKFLSLTFNTSLYFVEGRSIIQNILCLLVGLGCLSFSTFYISNYSYVRQVISSIGAVFNIILCLSPIMLPVVFEVLNKYNIILYVLSLVFFIISYVTVNYLSNKEELIINLQSLSKTYIDTQTIDE